MKNFDWGKIIITIFRAVIGWHFFYEGVTKLFVENWSATSFLANATGPFSGFYHWIASSETLMPVIDQLNIFDLILIGLALFLGIALRTSAILGILFLMLYYFVGCQFASSFMGSIEGNLFIVNRNLIEALALLTFFFLKEKGYGLYSLKLWSVKTKSKPLAEDKKEQYSSRREVIKNLATIPALGVFGWGAFNHGQMLGVDTLSGATIQVGGADISELKGELPQGKDRRA